MPSRFSCVAPSLHQLHPLPIPRPTPTPPGFVAVAPGVSLGGGVLHHHVILEHPPLLNVTAPALRIQIDAWAEDLEEGEAIRTEGPTLRGWGRNPRRLAEGLRMAAIELKWKEQNVFGNPPSWVWWCERWYCICKGSERTSSKGLSDAGELLESVPNLSLEQTVVLHSAGVKEHNTFLVHSSGIRTGVSFYSRKRRYIFLRSRNRKENINWKSRRPTVMVEEQSTGESTRF